MMGNRAIRAAILLTTVAATGVLSPSRADEPDKTEAEIIRRLQERIERLERGPNAVSKEEMARLTAEIMAEPATQPTTLPFGVREKWWDRSMVVMFRLRSSPTPPAVPATPDPHTREAAAINSPWFDLIQGLQPLPEPLFPWTPETDFERAVRRADWLRVPEEPKPKKPKPRFICPWFGTLHPPPPSARRRRPLVAHPTSRAAREPRSAGPLPLAEDRRRPAAAAVTPVRLQYSPPWRKLHRPPQSAVRRLLPLPRLLGAVSRNARGGRPADPGHEYPCRRRPPATADGLSHARADRRHSAAFAFSLTG